MQTKVIKETGKQGDFAILFTKNMCKGELN